jgi:hypothetical protein
MIESDRLLDAFDGYARIVLIKPQIIYFLLVAKNIKKSSGRELLAFENS